MNFLWISSEEDSHLGVAGTIFREPGYSSDTDSFEGQNHVSGQCQMFRRQCFEEIGGYFPSRVGGIDWIAVTTARMIGWKTRSFREKSFFHNRILGTADRGILASHFMYGKKDYYMGGHPVWQLFRCSYRMTKRPYLLGGIALFAGYVAAALGRTERPVSDELIRFHRKEQMAKLKAILASLGRFKRIDSFEIAPQLASVNHSQSERSCRFDRGGISRHLVRGLYNFADTNRASLFCRIGDKSPANRENLGCSLSFHRLARSLRRSFLRSPELFLRVILGERQRLFTIQGR